MNAVEPRVDGRRAATAARRRGGLLQRLLCQILRVGFVAAQRKRGAEQPVAVPVDEYRRGVCITPFQSGQDFRIPHSAEYVPFLLQTFNLRSTIFSEQDPAARVFGLADT